jgi:hypothetical protein
MWYIKQCRGSRSGRILIFLVWFWSGTHKVHIVQTKILLTLISWITQTVRANDQAFTGSTNCYLSYSFLLKGTQQNSGVFLLKKMKKKSKTSPPYCMYITTYYSTQHLQKLSWSYRQWDYAGAIISSRTLSTHVSYTVYLLIPHLYLGTIWLLLNHSTTNLITNTHQNLMCASMYKKHVSKIRSCSAVNHTKTYKIWKPSILNVLDY